MRSWATSTIFKEIKEPKIKGNKHLKIKGLPESRNNKPKENLLKSKRPTGKRNDKSRRKDKESNGSKSGFNSKERRDRGLQSYRNKGSKGNGFFRKRYMRRLRKRFLKS
jgi:hypothetical protein